MMRGMPVLAALSLMIASTGASAQQFHLLDNGTGTKQVVADGALTYALKDNGNTWCLQNGQWTKVDDGSGTSAIAASGGLLYVKKDDGSVWMRKFGQWSKIGKPGTKQLLADSGLLYTLESNDVAFLYNSNRNNWIQIDNGTGSRMLTCDLAAQNIVLYCLKNNGNIWQYQRQNIFGQGEWALMDDGSGTKAICAGAGMLYAMKDNGNIWRKNGNWAQIDNGSGTKQIAADGRYLFALKDNGNLWMYRDDQWQQIDNGTGTKMIEVNRGRILVLKDNGNIYEGDAQMLGAPGAPVRTDNFNRLHAE